MQKTRMANYDDLLALKLWAKWSKQFKAFNDNNKQQTISINGFQAITDLRDAA